MALGTSDVDQARFPRDGTGFASPDYATAINRVELHLELGIADLSVR